MWALLPWECGLPARKGKDRQARCLRSQEKRRTGAPDEGARGWPGIPLRSRASPLIRGIEENGERGGITIDIFLITDNIRKQKGEPQ